MKSDDEGARQLDLPTALLPALGEDLQTLALIHRRELKDDLVVYLRDLQFPQHLALKLASEPARAGADILTQAVCELSPPLSPQQRDELAADYAAIYLTHGYRASPYESVWLTDEHLTQQQPMFQIREWYRKYGLAAPDWRMTPDDHISFQLEFLGKMLTHDPEPALVEVAEFLDQHLLRWIDEFGARVSARCATPFYAGAALLTAGYCDTLRDVLALVLGTARPTGEEIEQRLRVAKCEEPVEVPVSYVPGIKPSW